MNIVALSSKSQVAKQGVDWAAQSECQRDLEMDERRESCAPHLSNLLLIL